MTMFTDLLPLKLCGKEGHPQRPDMQHGHGNPALTLKVPAKLPLYGLYVYYVVHICDFGMLIVKQPAKVPKTVPSNQ